MPLNTVRLNHRPSTHPNDRIVFIKPLPRPAHRQDEYDMADTFLRAIAAQCLPIMKTHWLSVTTLEEYEPNSEFMGRNFNSGECIQLVLRRGRGGGGKDQKARATTTTTTTATTTATTTGWLPFEVVQMVMMHELAHNVHMNHSKAFWATRDVFAAEMKALWARRYTGEGFWGGGRTLGDLTAALMRDGNGGGGVVPSQELADLPLCGGTYRSRRGGARKRKRKGEEEGAEAAPMTWKERKEKRIERKFGRNGVALGGDEEERMVLELGRKGGGSSVGVKPRVAGSKRGRELRAAAALKRFGVAAAAAAATAAKKDEEKEEATVSGDDEYDDDGEAEEEEDDDDDDGEAALDIDGNKLQDQHGRTMTRVCDGGGRGGATGDSDGDGDVHIKQELQELEGLDMYLFKINKDDLNNDHDHDDDDDNDNDHTQPPAKAATPTPPPAPPSDHRLSIKPSTISCPICSLDNPSMASTCSACAHVFDISKDPRHWACKSAACQGTAYINSGDAGVCGLCGERKPLSSPRE